MAILKAARYGKDNVRVYKVQRDEAAGTQHVTEMTVCCLLEGQIAESFTVADNSCVVATDSIKNTIYIKAKEHPVNPPELYASVLGQHFLDHFYRDGQETRNVEVRVTRGQGIDVKSAIAGLLVLKSTGSQFHGFVRDEFTTLPETWDRILSTEVDAQWKWAPLPGLAAVRDKAAGFDDAWARARAITMETFAGENSPSVQNTMYKMGKQILEAVPGVESVEYSLPNKHYFEIDLAWHNGLKNTGKDAEVYAPQSGPNGLIKCEVSRS